MSDIKTNEYQVSLEKVNSCSILEVLSQTIGLIHLGIQVELSSSLSLAMEKGATSTLAVRLSYRASST